MNRPCWGVMLAVLCFATALAAADEAQDSTPPPIRFRRVYASAAAIADWPRPAERYLPIEPAEFERLVEQARAEDSGVPRAAIATASYSARLERDVLVDGHAELNWEKNVSRGPLWTVAPLGLAVDGCTWSDDEPAVLGQHNGGETCVVSRPGQSLELDWTLQGHRDLTGALKFDLILPRALETTLALELPAGFTPSFEHGIVTPPEQKASPPIWHVSLGGHHRTSVRIVPSDPLSVRRRLPLARTAMTYRFSPRGLDISGDVRLEVQHDPVRQLELLLDPGMRLVSVRFGDTPVNWSLDPSPRGDTAVLDLGEAWQGAGRVLRVEALAPFETGHPFTLPRIQPQGVNWQEGSIALVVPAPLMVQRFVPIKARQSKGGPLPAPALGEAIELQCFAADATADLTVSRMTDPMQVAMGTSVRLARGKATARLIADCDVTTGERFFLVADIAEPWTIDSVATQPENVLGDWSILAAGENKPRRLALQLTRALRPDRPVRIVVEAQANMATDRSHRADDFAILRFQEATLDERLLGLSAAGSDRVKLDVRGELRSVPPEELSDEQRRLFGDPPPELILAHDTGEADWDVAVEPQAPQVEAHVTTEATVTSDQLIESYRIRCVPQSGNIGRLHVHFSEARSEPLMWHFSPQQRGQVTIREVAPSEAPAEFAADGRTWEIIFRQRIAEPIEFRAVRSSPFGERLPLSLISVSEALTEHGLILIRAAGNLPLSIADQGLSPVAAAAPDDAGPPVRAAYQYTSDRETVSELQSITLTRLESTYSHSGTLVWSSHTDSRYDPDGQGTHRTSLRIESAGRRTIGVSIEQGELTAAWIDGRQTTLSGQQATLELPAGKAFPLVMVEHHTQDAPLAALSSRTVTRPQVDVPTIAERHTVWLPPGYELAGERPPADGLGWLARWAGPLYRRPGTPMFDPIHPVETLSIVAVDEPAGVDSSLERLLDHLGRRQTTTTRTWGGLLREAMAAGDIGTPLVIDDVALEAMGVTPDSAMPRLQADRPLPSRQVALMRLQRAGLAILVAPRTLVLTSGEFVATARDDLDAIDSLAVYAVRGGELQNRLDRRVSGDPRTTSVAAWQGDPPETWPDDPNNDATIPVGWSGVPLTSRIEGTTIYLVRAANVHVGGWTGFLLLAIVGSWRLRRRRDLLALLAVAFAILALLLPANVAPWASGALLGTLFSWIGLWLTPWLPPTPRVETRSEGASTVARAVTTSAILLAVVLGGLHWSRASAAEKEVDATPWVFIPCDEDGKPNGDRYQVPASLDAELRRRAQSGGSATEGWLLTAANYELSLMHDAMQGLAIADMTVDFDVQTFRENTEVQIPWDLAEMEAPPEAALVDGRYVALDYRDGQLIGNVAEPGLSRLEVPLRPRRSTSDGEPSLTMTLPRVANAHMHIKSPADGPEIEVLGAMGAETPASGDRPLTVSLGPTSDATVRWTAALEAPSVLEVDELYWLQVRPGSSTVNARLKVRGLPPHARRIRLAVDPRLRLLPLAADQPITDVISLPGSSETQADAREVQLVIDRDAGADLELQLSFLLTNTSGVGNVRLPRLEVLDATSNRRWLGVTIDPALETEVQGGEAFVPVDPAEFVALWSGAAAPPGLAYELPHGSTNWTLAIRPRQAQTTAEQRLTVTAGQQWVDVSFQAALVTSDGFSFQHSLIAPKEFVIDGVSLVSEGVQRASRWTQEPTGRIVVFLNAPVTGRQTLTLRGRMPVPKDGTLPLPMIRLADAPLKGTRIDVYRRASVQVELTDRHDLSELPAATPEPASEHAWVVATLQADAPTSAASLHIAPNDVTASVVQISSLKREGLVWIAEVDMLWSVKHGTLDVLRLEIPDDWSGPFTIVPPPASSEVIELPGHKRHLLIYPRASITSLYRVTVTGPVGGDSGQSVRLKRVAPVGAAVEAYVRLPSHAGLQRVDWETSQLRPAELPAELSSSSIVEDVSTYRVIGPEPVARLRRVERVTDAQHVRLTDVRWAWQGGDHYVAWAGFDLDPAGATNCIVQLPAAAELIEARVDGQITTAESLNDGRWTVDLRLRQLPERVEVWYRGPARAGAWRTTALTAPHIDGAPADKVLWTIYGGEWMPSQPQQATRLDTIGAELVRLAGLTAQVDLPPDDVSAQGSDELGPWFAERRTHWLATRDAIVRLSTGTNDATATMIELSRLEQEFKQAGTRLEVTEADAVTGDVDVSSPGRLWDEAFADQPLAMHLLYTNTDRGPTLRLEGGSDLPGRWAGVVLLAGLAIGGYLLRNRLAAPLEFLERWPQVAGVLMGLAWWLWLTPSVVGLVIALVCIASGLRPGLRYVREGSAGVVRVASRTR